MKETITTYKCDTCSRTEVRNNGSEYPFTLGWIRLDALEMGIPINATHRLVEQPKEFKIEEQLDFCSKNCFLQRIIGEIDEGGQVPKFGNPYENKNMENLGSQSPQSQGYDDDIRPPQRVERTAPPSYSEEVARPEEKKRRGFFGRKKS